MNRVYVTKSPEETQALGEALVKKLPPVFALHGELGSGKTTFVQGLARGLGVKRRIISPTFIIVRTYKLKAQSSNRKIIAQNMKLFYHIDLYRIENKNDVLGLGLKEIMSDKQGVVAIEWAEKIRNLLPKNRVEAYFEYIDENKRKIIIQYEREYRRSY